MSPNGKVRDPLMARVQGLGQMTVQSCQFVMGYYCTFDIHVPYTSKFSRHVIFAVFADFSYLRKLSSRNFRIPYTRNS